MNKNIKLVSPCHRVKVKIEPKKDLVDQIGKTFYFVCPKCNKACDPIDADAGIVLAVEPVEGVKE